MPELEEPASWTGPAVAQQEVASPIHTADLSPVAMWTKYAGMPTVGAAAACEPHLRAKPLLGVCKRQEDRLLGEP